MKTIKINEEFLCYCDYRIDKFLSIIEKDNFTRSKIEEYIKNGNVKVNDKITKASYKLKENDYISYEFKEEVFDISYSTSNLSIDVIYEDDDLAVINKPRGLVVHPGNGHSNDTLVNLLINTFSNLSTINGEFRPGIVHRIDKDTSGLLIIAKNDMAHALLAEQLKDHDIKRDYVAICKGVIKENSGKIIAPIARDEKNRIKMGVNIKKGKEAITFFSVEERLKNHTLVKVKLLTGRTHQIRVHMSYIGYPIEGDPLYNSHFIDFNGQLLHAYKISFLHPRTKKELSFECPIPDYFKEAIEKLK